MINLDSRVTASIVTVNPGNEGRSYPHGSTVGRSMIHTEVSRNLSTEGMLPLNIINYREEIVIILKIL